MQDESAKKIPGWLYTALFKVWHWYAVHILRVPWIICYNPPPDNNILGMTYAWSRDYVERVQRGFLAEQHIAELTAELKAYKQGTRSARRMINRAARKAAQKELAK